MVFGRGGFVVAVGGVEGDGGVGEHLVHGLAAHHFGGGASEHLAVACDHPQLVGEHERARNVVGR